MGISLRLKELRSSKGMSQTELAQCTGLTRKSIINYENGYREPNSKAMATLEEFFGVSGAYLRGESEDSEPRISDALDVMDEVDRSIETLATTIQNETATSKPEIRKMVFDILSELCTALTKRPDEQQLHQLTNLHSMVALYAVYPPEKPLDDLSIIDNLLRYQSIFSSFASLSLEGQKEMNKRMSEYALVDRLGKT